MALTIVETRAITGGVDTHADTHVAAALDPIGGLLGVREFPVTPHILPADSALGGGPFGRMLSGRRSAGSVCPGSGWQSLGVGPSACGPGADSVCIVALAAPGRGHPMSVRFR